MYEKIQKSTLPNAQLCYNFPHLAKSHDRMRRLKYSLIYTIIINVYFLASVTFSKKKINKNLRLNYRVVWEGGVYPKCVLISFSKQI